MDKTPHHWLLLLHQIPPKPAYFRAKVQRRLKRLGALPVKNSAYLLPATDETLEDFQWLVSEIRSEGGEAWLFESEVLAGSTDAALEREFTEISSAEYRELAKDLATVLDDRRNAPASAASELADGGAPRQEWQRLRRRREAIRQRDHFPAQAAEEVRTLMSEIEQTMKSSRETPEHTGSSPAGIRDFRARTWVTRRNVKIDRIASAWLIRRFVDPAARFLFVDEDTHEPRPAEVRFDMFQGEFTHRGPHCTFEVLVEDVALTDPVLTEIAEIVHDIDLKDDLYGRPEAVGIAAVIDGLVLREPDDARRLEQGGAIFDGLYEQLRRDGKLA